jgi:hypothetical protein
MPKPVKVIKKQRRKNPPRTAYSKEHPSPHAFKKGECTNPGGKRKTGDDLVGKWLTIDSSDRAPDSMCASLSLPPGSSWGRVLARRLMYFAMNGEAWAYAEIREYTQGSRVNLFGSIAVGGDPGDAPSLIQIQFVESDGNGRMKEPLTIEGSQPALPASAVD